MEGNTRREQIIHILTTAQSPISGTELADMLNVSRQVIVQDIALLRATNKNIISTNKGYLLFVTDNAMQKYHRTFKVAHSDEQMQDELNTIVDAGGKVLDVVVEHDVYGQISVDLILCNRADVESFIQKITASNSKPLKVLTDGVHFHTVEADSEEILKRIYTKLSEKGYLQ